MIDPKELDELARKLAEAVPAGLREIKKDLESNFRAVLQATLARLDLVTREEFDAQAAVLTRTRERLEQLMQRLKELEETLLKRKD